MTPGPDLRFARRALKPALFLLALIPAGVMVFDAFTGRLAAEPIKDLTHRTGTWTITCLTATLAVTPLRRLTGWSWLISLRRMLGLFAFCYASSHFLVYLVLDQFFDWHTIVKDIAKRPYITVGFTGLVLMSSLAVTSTKKMVRRLGRRWVQLHALIYVIALAGIVHFTWSQKADILRPTIFGIIIATLLALRLVPRTRNLRTNFMRGRKKKNGEVNSPTPGSQCVGAAFIERDGAAPRFLVHSRHSSGPRAVRRAG